MFREDSPEPDGKFYDSRGTVGPRRARQRFRQAFRGMARPGFPRCRKSDMIRPVRVHSRCCFASPLWKITRTDAAIIPADADMHPLPIHRRNALHQMWRVDEACPHRATKPTVRFVDLPLRALRQRRKLPEGNVRRSRSRLSNVIRLPASWLHSARCATC